MRWLLLIFTVLLSATFLSAEEWNRTILPFPVNPAHYKIVHYYSQEQPFLLIIREITLSNGSNFFLAINTTTLSSVLLKGPVLKSSNSIYSNALFLTLLHKETNSCKAFGTLPDSQPADSKLNVILTTDLCPTKNKYDALFYQCLQELNTNKALNSPFIIFFTGRWLATHYSDLDAIKKSGLSFIAGNHTYHHTIITNTYSPALLTAEITNTEVVMLANSLLPSCFFRFPGLKYRPAHVKELSKIGLIAIDANAWMGTKVPDWSFLLVHSNGTVSSEVRMFARWLKKKNIVFQDIPAYFRYKNQYTRKKRFVSKNLMEKRKLCCISGKIG